MPYELKDRQHGWMNAIGLLFEHVSDDAADSMRDAFRIYGDDLWDQIKAGGHDATAVAENVNPCGPGYTWDSEQGCCVLDTSP